MESFPIMQNKNNFKILTPKPSLYVREYVEDRYDLCLNEEYAEDNCGDRHKYFRLHAKHPHNTEMALAYEITCPCCHCRLKPVARMLNCYDLFLYECPSCSKN